MAFSRIQGASGQTSTNQLVIGISAAGAGNLIVGAVQMLNTTETVTSVTDDKGNSYVVSSAVDNTARGYQFYGVQVTSGATSVIINFSGSSASKHASVDEFSGGANSNAAVIDQTNSTTGSAATSSAASPALVPSASGKLVVGSIATNGSISSPAAGTNYTLGASESKSFQVYRLSATTSETAPASWTTSHEWIEFATSFNLASTDLQPSVFDSVTITESITMLVDASISPFEAVTLTESVSIDAPLLVSAGEDITISENLTIDKSGVIAPTEDVVVSESVTVFLENLAINVFHAVTLTESVAVAQVPDATLGLMHMRSNEQSYPLMMDDQHIE